MKIVDNGVLSTSFMEALVPSEFAESALFFSPRYGSFQCNENYCIERTRLDLYLFMYVCKGALEVETSGQKVHVEANQIILINCREPHKYTCQRRTDFYWFHFHGSSSQQYAQYLHTHFGLVYSGEHVLPLKEKFELISTSVWQTNREHLVSLQIHHIFSTLAMEQNLSVDHTKILDPSLAFIHSHFDEEIELLDLAELCSLSISHFIRTFKQHTNLTPHEYLLSYRLRQAKRLLLTSSYSVERIAEKSGFNSASHFARSFRKNTGLSPTEFRNMP
ncbi:MAG: helix-turn-helix domain-containing protein [Lachnospiraceae bacterium]